MDIYRVRDLIYFTRVGTITVSAFYCAVYTHLYFSIYLKVSAKNDSTCSGDLAFAE